MKSFLGLTIFLMTNMGLWGQNRNPIEKVRFYSPEELPLQRLVEDDRIQSFYNKAYDPTEFKGNFFAPWRTNLTREANSVRNSQDWNKFFEAAARLTESPCYSGNYRVYSQQLKNRVLQNTAAEEFPNMSAYGMVTRTVNVRKLPTSEFCFKGVRDAGEGYPFDYHQETSLWAGTPLAILHRSLDKDWLFVISPYGSGWVESSRVGLTNENEVKKLMKDEWATVKIEQAILQGKDHHLKGRIGMLLPIAKKRGEVLEVLIPVRTTKGKLNFAAIETSEEVAEALPLVFNAKNIQFVINQLVGTKYSWGGLDEGRDCSATLKDFFTPFGIWLPRNSTDQREVGRKVRIEGDEATKLLFIRENAVPFMTIIYKRGHSMLYAGTTKGGIPLIFHNVWGLKPVWQDKDLDKIVDRRDELGLFGINRKEKGIAARFIIGEASITAVNPEHDFSGIKFDAFIQNIESMNVIK